jgi:membrane-bound lytic murein transglycosylase A
LARRAARLLAPLLLAACASTPNAPSGPRPPPSPAPPSPLAEAPTALAVEALPGWAQDDHAAAFAAWRQACGRAGEAVAGLCREAQTLGPLGEAEARRFFDARFEARAIPGEGVLTGYFAPIYAARRAPDGEFSAPLRPKPAVVADLDRAAIEAQPAAEALAWLRPEDLFFLQVQGSGALVFEDGARAKALYAANNGRPYTPIGAAMREQGLLAPGQVSAQAIHDWLAAHRGPDAAALMQRNARYVFFRLAPDDGRAPPGAAGVPLPAGRAVAVDPTQHPMGELLWIDGERPTLAGARPLYQRLVTALDTGGAIRGPVRADLYVGEGAAAGEEAGLVHHRLRLWRLVPKAAS